MSETTPTETPPAFIIDFLKEQERDKKERSLRIEIVLPLPDAADEEE